MRLPEDLLEQAQHLARREPKRPRQASLRRAVSTAYYALFHLLISEAILNWKRVADREDLARMFEHANMKTACAKKRDELDDEFRKMKTTAPPGHDLTVKKHLHLVAKVATVDAAFEAWKAIRKEDTAQAFLFTLLQKKRR